MMKNGKLALVFLMAIALIFAGCSTPEPVEEETEPVQQPAPEEEHEEHEEHEMQEEEQQQSGVLGMVATAPMLDAEGEEVGTVVFTQTEAGVLVEGTLAGQESGEVGFHVHEFGECEVPDFMSAGGHFNPQGHPHGEPDAEEGARHAGDFGNLEFDEDGVASFSFVDDVISLGEGENDVVGHALILHEERDDLETQPTGDAGPRAACGVIEAM